jgi:hypothetical protein
LRRGARERWALGPKEHDMNDLSLQRLERDVEATRARLARNLRTLRSPTAHAEFTEAIKHDAFAAKDELVERTRSAAQDRINNLVDNLKARTAENPAAVLAIAAGIGWRMIRNPPIATALIGVGLFSLLRGNAPSGTGRSDEDYVDRARARLRQQSDELAAGVADRANAVATAAARKMGQLGEQAQTTLREGGAQAAGKIEQWSEQAQSALREGSAQAADKMENWSEEAREALQKGSAEAAGKVADWSEKVRMCNGSAQGADTSIATGQKTVHPATRATQQAQAASEVAASATGPEFTNQLLLGTAGAAIAAALALALQRRVTQAVDRGG